MTKYAQDLRYDVFSPFMAGGKSMSKIISFTDYKTNYSCYHPRKKRKKNTMCKMVTPEYVKDMREGRYTMTACIDKIFKECHIETYPINVFRIARLLNFDIIYGKFKKDSVYGAMWDGSEEVSVGNKKSKRFILLNADDSDERKAFTVAHELGHFFLHCNDNQNFYERYHSNGSQSTQQRKIENEADFFAANLLLPEFVFMNYINLHKNLSRRKLSSKICKDFMVEEETVSKRFEELGVRR